MFEPTQLRYRAFLSYAHKDRRAAERLHKRLEAFRIDKDVVGRDTPIGSVPKSLRPIFRDREDFSGGHSLTDATLAVLDQSAALIVLCSPHAAASHYVNEEVRLFRHRHPGRPVIPVIVEGGYPASFPPALRLALDGEGGVTAQPVTILGADLQEKGDGQTLGLAKVVAGMTGLAPLDVFNRFKAQQRREARLRWSIAAVMLLLAVGTGYLFYEGQKKSGVIEAQQETQSQALAIARQMLGANPAAAASPGAEQNLVQALTAIQQSIAAGDADYAKAFDALKAGKGAEAVPLLVAAAEAKEARAAKENREAAKAYREAAAVAAVAEPWRARDLYAKAARLDPDDIDGVFQNGWFQQEAGALAAAEDAYRRIVAGGKAGTHDRALYWARLGLGDIQSERGDLGVATATYREAGAIADRLAKADPGNAGWQRDLSVSYNEVGEVLVAQGQLPDALKAFRDSLAIADRLAKADPGNAGWQRDVAVSHAKVGDAYGKAGDAAKAGEHLRAGRDIIAGLVARYPDWARWKQDLAWLEEQVAALEGK